MVGVGYSAAPPGAMGAEGHPTACSHMAASPHRVRTPVAGMGYNAAPPWAMGVGGQASPAPRDVSPQPPLRSVTPMVAPPHAAPSGVGQDAPLWDGKPGGESSDHSSHASTKAPTTGSLQATPTIGGLQPAPLGSRGCGATGGLAPPSPWCADAPCRSTPPHHIAAEEGGLLGLEAAPAQTKTMPLLMWESGEGIGMLDEYPKVAASLAMPPSPSAASAAGAPPPSDGSWSNTGIKPVPLVVVAEGAVWNGFGDFGSDCAARDADIGDCASVAGATSVAGSASSEARRRRQQKFVPIVAMPVVTEPEVGPFSEEACGANIGISEDGYVAERCCGCRDAAAVGSRPLERQARGLYFEIKVRQTVDGWLGGLGIGVTHTPPGTLPKLPDKALALPETFIAGYSGSVYLNGTEQRTSWQPENLKIGQHVGLLITGDGREHFKVFIDGVERLHVDGADLHAFGLRDAPLFPVLDIHNATQCVELIPGAMAPSASAPGHK